MASGIKTGGRIKGTPNKFTADLKAAILGAFEAKGGQKYLERVAETDPRTFCSLLAKILPTQLTADSDGDSQQHLIISWTNEIMATLDGQTRGLPSEHNRARGFGANGHVTDGDV